MTAALVPADVRAQFAVAVPPSGVLAGRACATEAFARLDPDIDLRWFAEDGDELAPGDTLLELAGRLRPILTAERTALNFLGRLSGVATLTAQFVTAAHESNPSVAVLDTRKTTPGLRLLEKAAVRAGGGTNHRVGLSDAHVGEGQPPGRDQHRRRGAAGPGRCGRGRWSRSSATPWTRWPQAARAGADAVLLDNMDPGTVVEAIAVAHLDTRRAHPHRGVGQRDAGHHRRLRRRGTGLDIGGCAHPLAPVLDLGLDLLWTTAVAEPLAEGT